MIPLEPATLLLVEYPGSGVYTIRPVDTDYGMSLLVTKSGGNSPAVLRLDYAGELAASHVYTNGAGYVEFTAAAKTGFGTLLIGQQPATGGDWNTFVRVGHDGAVLLQDTLEKTTGFPVAYIGTPAVLGTDTYIPFVEGTGAGGASASDYGVIKLNAAGEIVWQKSRLFSASEATSTAMVVGGNIVAVFERANTLEIYTLSTAGALLSAYTIANDSGSASAATDGSSIYLDGYIDPGLNSRVLTKHAAGTNLWSKRIDIALFNGYGYDQRSITYYDGHIYQTVLCWNATSGAGGGTNEVVLVKVAADGTLVQSWGFRYGLNVELWEANVAVNADGVTLTILTDAAPEALAFVFTFGHDADCYGDYGDTFTVYQPSVTLTDITLTVASSAFTFGDSTRTLLNEGAVALGGTGPDVSEVAISTDPGFANGFRTTLFGVPEGSIGTFANATGFSTTAFGSHISRYLPEGFSTTSLGVPYAVFDQFLPATGFVPTVIGAPAYAQVGVASSLEPGTIVSGAFTAQDQMVFSTGRTTTRFGNAIYRAETDIDLNQFLTPDGWRVTRFGTPQAPQAREFVAYGFSLTAWGYPAIFSARPGTEYGTPRSRITQPAATLPATTAFGQPTAPWAAEGFRSTALGTPVGDASHTASGLLRTRFGTPFSSARGHRTYGFLAGRKFGRPRALQAFYRTTTGWTATSVGEPACAQKYRPTHMAPTAGFGVPTLQRNPEC